MAFATARIATGMLAVSAFALVAASITTAQAAKRAEADAKKAFVVSCMQGKQG
jgi:hypothetical protein